MMIKEKHIIILYFSIHIVKIIFPFVLEKKLISPFLELFCIGYFISFEDFKCWILILSAN